MNVTEAVQAAKSHIERLFVDEPITHVGLEEIEFVDHPPGTWKITIGFMRVWGPYKGMAATLGALGHTGRRTYKTVLLEDSNGEIISVKNREPTGS